MTDTAYDGAEAKGCCWAWWFGQTASQGSSLSDFLGFLLAWNFSLWRKEGPKQPVPKIERGEAVWRFLWISLNRRSPCQAPVTVLSLPFMVTKLWWPGEPSLTVRGLEGDKMPVSGWTRVAQVCLPQEPGSSPHNWPIPSDSLWEFSAPQAGLFSALSTPAPPAFQIFLRWCTSPPRNSLFKYHPYFQSALPLLSLMKITLGTNIMLKI